MSKFIINLIFQLLALGVLARIWDINVGAIGPIEFMLGWGVCVALIKTPDSLNKLDNKELRR